MTTNTVLPAIGDAFVGMALVYTVTAVVEIEADDATHKVVLSHPLGGELHLPDVDFFTMVERGHLTKEPTA